MEGRYADKTEEKCVGQRERDRWQREREREQRLKQKETRGGVSRESEWR